MIVAGCATEYGVRPVKIHQRFEQLDRSALTSKKPSEGTLLFLRQHDKLEHWYLNPEKVIVQLDIETGRRPHREILFSMMELSYLQARGQNLNSENAARLYWACALYAYNYLFDPELGPPVDPYDPRSRMVCEFYNRSISALMIHFRSQNLKVREGMAFPLLNGEVQIAAKESKLAWDLDEFQSFHLAYEFKAEGFDNHYGAFGLGAPLVAVRMIEPAAPRMGLRDYFSPLFRQTYAVTMMVRFSPFIRQMSASEPVYQVAVDALDPINTPSVHIHNRKVPLESDFTIPLAYMIDISPVPHGIKGLLDVDSWQSVTGMHMLQPYQPDKIPVVFVHGLMSSPETWLPMLNNLMGDPELRQRYQFWFFMYPTGSPVLYSANILRNALNDLRDLYSKDRAKASFNQMVLIGHSMGGLLSKTMVQSGGTPLWQSIFKNPIEKINVTNESRVLLKQIFYYEPLPFVQRVVFIATPHRGSKLADSRIGLWGASFINLPRKLMNMSITLLSAIIIEPIENLTATGDSVTAIQLNHIPTSIDGLSPNNPVLKTVSETPIAKGVTYHSIIGNTEAGDTPGGSDGVVPYESAHLEGAYSEKIVHSGHSAHNHPLAILEVRRILLEHLGEKRE
jgi:triacylglycerol esterase/lipase EstA (alpha/beta hydrolase family)